MNFSIDQLQFLIEILKEGKNSYFKKSHKYVVSIDGYRERQKEILNKYEDMIVIFKEEKKRLKK